MLKQGTFINKKFNRLLLGNIWGWIGYCANMMVDSLISGNQLGEVSLQAVSIVFPLFSVVYFVSHLISPGASILFGKRVGEFKKEEAYRTAGTGFISSVLSGIILAIGLWLIKEPFLTYFECTGDLYSEASIYYSFVIVYSLIHPLQNCVYYFSVTDGEAILATVACTLEIVANVVLSVVLSRLYGIAGLGMATCIALLLSLLSYSMHFIKKSNNVRIRFCLDYRIVGKSLVLSLSRYAAYLFMGIVDIVMNKIIISTAGVVLIPAYSVVNLVFSICECYGALNDAGVGLVTCFLGERNNHDMKAVFRKTGFSMLIMAGGITALFFFGAPLMPVIYGLETPETVAAAIMTSRVVAFAALGYGACYLSSELSCSVEKPFQACFISFLDDVFSPLLLSLIFGSIWGYTGIVIGMCFSSYVAFGLYALIRIPVKGKKGFPIYFKDYGEEGCSFDLYVTPDSITEIRDAVCGELVKHGYNIKNADLLMEEFYTRVMEKNPGKKVLAECTLLFGENQVRIISRDDGVLFNFVNENNRIESMNAYVLNNLLEQTEQKNYLVTASFNRNGFAFDKSGK